MALVNNNNFLRWDDGIAPAADIARLPEGYIQDVKRCFYKPVLVSGEAMRFYINAENGLTALIPDDTNLFLKLVNAKTDTIVNADLANLQIDNYADDNFTLYAEVVIDNSINPGDYYLIITDESSTYLTSNLIQVLQTNSNYRDYSARVTYAHDRYFYGFNFQSVTTFTNQFRLHLNEIDMQPETDKEVYNEVTTGKQRVYNNFKKRLRKIEAYYFDEFAHEAADIMFDCDNLLINGKPYKAKDTYKINRNVLSKIYKGECDVYDIDFATANRCLVAGGGPPTPVCNAVEFDSFDLPNGIVGQYYSYSVPILGTPPFALNSIVKPDWMTIEIVGISTLIFRGTPDDVLDDFDVMVNVTNCTSDQWSISESLDVLAGTRFSTTPQNDVTFEDSDNKIFSTTVLGPAGAVVTLKVTNLNDVGGIGNLNVDGNPYVLNDTFDITLDGSGTYTFPVDIQCADTSGSSVNAELTITATSIGDVVFPEIADYSKSQTESNDLHIEEVSTDDTSTDRHHVIRVVGAQNVDFTLTVTSYYNGGGSSDAHVGATLVTAIGNTFSGNTLGTGYKEYDLYVHFDGVNHIGFTITITAAAPGAIGTPASYGMFL